METYSTTELFGANELLLNARCAAGITQREVLIQAGLAPEGSRHLKTNLEWYVLLEDSNALPFFPGDFLRPILGALKISVEGFKEHQRRALIEAAKPIDEFVIVGRIFPAVYNKTILVKGTTLSQARKQVAELSKKMGNACLRTTLICNEYYSAGTLSMCSASIPSGGITEVSQKLDFDSDAFKEMELIEW